MEQHNEHQHVLKWRARIRKTLENIRPRARDVQAVMDGRPDQQRAGDRQNYGAQCRAATCGEQVIDERQY